ncbi:tripartite tricarboxylate transporter TctB family protein [Marinobacterium sedimentorum]|uniref:tripartite tricarboxylate transporter TctB family protein n=1 Tax=Marinobacterium sedimentorum TaxID=2927804 RepID=UPI0020C5D069|nr:tripartite tricarboxylate transporter TctB family protein [Marinobacterium sedimentorum]MCP8689497.1 tripartite tricarboxylate transporter TctB family protein [Marinobacterium sedimentorum]
MRINDWFLGLLLAALGVATLVAAQAFPTIPRQEYGAGTFPAIIGSLMTALGSLLVLSGCRQHMPFFSWHSKVSLSRSFACFAAVIAFVLAYLLLTPLLGFPIVAPVLLALMIGWLSGGRWVMAVSVATVMSAMVWLAFAELLHVPLSLGVLEEVIY